MKHVVMGIISRRNENDEEEFLLVKSKRDFGKYTGFYYPPGGHVKEGENEEKALIREIKEELDLDIEPVEKIAETDSDVENQITHWWLCNIKTRQLKIKKDEIADAKYFTKNDMQKIKMWPATRKFFEKFIFLQKA